MLNYVESLNKFGIVEHLASFLNFLILRLFCYQRIFSVALFVSEIWPMDPEMQNQKIYFFEKLKSFLNYIFWFTNMEARHLPTLTDAPGWPYLKKNITSSRHLVQ